MKNKPLLSISILVSNRIDTIRKCMESIKPLLTGISCELVAIDTVGETTDGSIDVVREYTDKIYRFEWCNDFAKARNFGLDKCTGEWFMFMDDDEWFEDVTEILEFFTSGEYKKYNCANYKIHTYINHEGRYGVASLFRMVKRIPQTKFIGRVHEYLHPLQAPAKEFSAYIHHYGYLFDTPEEKKAHSERNISLLEPEFKKDPWNMHIRMQLLQEYIFLPELEDKAIALCEENLKADKKYYKTNEFQWMLQAYLKLANRDDDYETVVERAEMIRANYPLSALADLSISTIEMNSRVRLGQYEKGYAVFEHAMGRRKYLEENPDVKQHLKALDLDAFMEDDIYCEMLKFGARCCNHLGKTERAEEIIKERFEHAIVPVVTVSVLVSNRKDTIRKCLDSIKPLLDAVPSELIIVDTVGEEKSDGSLAIAREYTNHIVPFVWCDDFAAARNAGLQAAKGEWFLYLDDDEWFENIEEIVRFFTSGEYFEYNSATYFARNYKDKAGTTYSDDVVGRMIHLAKNSEFVGCINETFNNLYLPHKELSAYVHHYGFAYENQEAKQARMAYTQRLLQLDLERYPGNLRNRAQLAAVYSVKAPAEAVKLCVDTLEVCKDKKDNIPYQWQAVVLYGAYENLKLLAEAEAEYQKLRAEELLLPVTEQVVCYRLARLCIMQNLYAKAYPYAKRYFELLEAVSEAEIPKEFEKYQDGSCAEEMLNFGAFCAWQAKEYDDAWKWYECMAWETMGAAAEDPMWKLFAMAEEKPDDDALFRIIKRIMTNSALKPVLGKLMQNNELVKQRVNKTMDAKRRQNTPEKEIIVSISMLVSNRKDTIRKSLESIKPLLDAVPSELIVVDTVGEENSDGSIAIAREYTDHIVYFPWCKDFAAARNAGLKEAKGKWYLTIDDDEWFEDISPIIDFFKSGDYKNYDRGWYYVRNYHNMGGTEWVDTLADRMCRLTPETRYEGRVHESLCPTPEKPMQFFCYAHHYGYVYKDQEEAQKHSDRNCSLLEIEVKERPDDARMVGQLIQEYAVIGRLEEGVKACEEWLDKHKDQQDNPFSQSIAVLWLRMSVLIDDTETSAALLDKLEHKFSLREVPTLACMAEGVPLQLRRKNYEEALRMAEKYFRLYRIVTEKGEAVTTQKVFDLTKYLEKETIDGVITNAMTAVILSAQYDRAKLFLDYVDWTNTEKKPFGIMMQLVELYAKSGNGELFFPYAEQILNNPGMKKPFTVSLGDLVRDYPERKDTISAWLAKITGRAPKRAVNPELEQLAEQLKQNIKAMIDAGNVAEAGMLLQGLKEMVPGDEELAELERMIQQ